MSTTSVDIHANLESNSFLVQGKGMFPAKLKSPFVETMIMDKTGNLCSTIPVLHQKQQDQNMAAVVT